MRHTRKRRYLCCSLIPPRPMTHHYDSSLVNAGTFDGIVFKNESFMIVTRTLDVPLRTTDGGKNWEPMTSCAPVAEMGKGLIYSWSGNTLIMMGSGGTQTEDHPYVGLMTRMSHMYISISPTLSLSLFLSLSSCPSPSLLSTPPFYYMLTCVSCTLPMTAHTRAHTTKARRLHLAKQRRR